MRTVRPLARASLRCSPLKLISLILAALVLSLTAAAQQPAPAQKRIPRLTTDDVIAPAQGSDQPAKSEDSANAANTDAAKAQAAKPQANTNQVSSEEAAWREQVSKARERAKQLKRAAEETELRVTAIRNELGAPGNSPKQRNQLAAELEQTGQRLTDLLAKASVAEDDLKQLLEYGRQKKYSEAEGPKASAEDGKPNEEFYRSQFAKLVEQLQTAERQMQLYENRIRELNTRISGNSGSGDNFYIMQIQKERNEAQKKLDEARAARSKAQNDIEALQDQARRAGVSPGVFR